MAYVLKQQSASAATAGTGTTITPTLPGNTTAGNTLIAFITSSQAASQTVSSIATEASWAKIASSQNATDTTRSEIWMATNITGGASSYQITMSHTNVNTTASLVEFTISGASVVDNAPTGTTGATSTATSPTITAASSSSLDLALQCNDNGIGKASGPTNSWIAATAESTSLNGHFPAWKTAPSASDSTAWTLNVSQAWAVAGVSIKLSGGTSVALTGLAGTSNKGTLAPSASVALSGVAATASPGTLAPSVSSALSGLAAASATGTLAPSASVALPGLAGTGSPGTLAPSASIALSGQEAVAAFGTVTPSSGTVVGLTGLTITASAGTLTPSGVKPIDRTYGGGPPKVRWGEWSTPIDPEIRPENIKVIMARLLHEERVRRGILPPDIEKSDRAIDKAIEAQQKLLAAKTARERLAAEREARKQKLARERELGRIYASTFEDVFKQVYNDRLERELATRRRNYDAAAVLLLMH